MIWHILKKDWKLLWRLVAGVAAVHVASTAALFSLGRFGENRTFMPLIDLFQMLGLFASACLIAAVVHQDAVPGVRQDWLVRPIRRRDLMLAKFLFVLVMLQGPVLAADLIEGLANGFSFNQSLGAAISRSAYLLLGFNLPVLAFASLTRSFTQAVVGGLAAFMGAAAFIVVGNAFRESGHFSPTEDTGLMWVPESARLALFLLGAIAVLGVQYYRRRTFAARLLLSGVGLLCLLTELLPWQSAFAIEQRLSPNRGGGRPILVAFGPDLGKFRNPAGLNLDEAELWRRVRRGEGEAFVYLPLRVSGLPTDVVLHADRSEVRLIGTDGKTENVGPGGDLEIRKEGPGDGVARIHQAIHIRGDLYNRMKDRPVRLEVHYSLTLFRLSNSYAIPALNGDQRMPGVGWCATKVNDSGTSVRFRCLEAGQAPSCATLFLEHVPDGRRNPERSACEPDYKPFFGRYFPDDAMGRFGVNLPFRDPSGLAKFPVDGPQLPQSRVVVRVYQPQDHFTRELVIPEIRLKDWEAE
jgi:hypothetical protein